MTEVLHSPPSPSLQTHNDTPLFQYVNQESEELQEGVSRVTNCDDELKVRRERDNQQLSLLALLLTLLRKSFWVASSCKTTAAEEKQDLSGMEIGWPTNVRHVAHVTFDRFNGFLGLPVEFEPEVPRRAPSASATVFGVSTQSMQLSHDFRGNSIPTILLLMQQRLYSQGGLQAEGVFRINAENGQEEHLRNQLNSGVVPDGIDVHCLAGLIKAWFRELPTGVLDPLSPEQVMQCESEEDCAALIRLLPLTEAALLDWAVNLMADVVQQEHFNKMNSHNIAMVFAPNMTQMADPLTALMYAVQVMNFLKTLVTKTLREREDSVMEPSPVPRQEPSDENGHHGPPHLCHSGGGSENREDQFINEDSSGSDSILLDNITDDDHLSYSTSTEEYDGPGFCETPVQTWHVCRTTQLSGCDKSQGLALVVEPVVERSKGISNLSSINSQMERIGVWL
ncbi:rho GTPase-activating protein 5-like [Cynara cardunculus var. scolymus]|uniref:rho GTPase-activating protein 5-like n=1 Tax=Cynara cardunculus var. scolymus TaxID=59895 RepID=UPI000D627F06|nr:rho GTPase-activating protein 5-like [Cynara cardunculus var. scolymus]